MNETVNVLRLNIEEIHLRDFINVDHIDWDDNWIFGHGASAWI